MKQILFVLILLLISNTFANNKSFKLDDEFYKLYYDTDRVSKEPIEACIKVNVTIINNSKQNFINLQSELQNLATETYKTARIDDIKVGKKVRLPLNQYAMRYTIDYPDFDKKWISKRSLKQAKKELLFLSKIKGISNNLSFTTQNKQFLV